MATELQELRAAKHERRWRKIRKEGLPKTGEEAMNAEWSDGEIILNSDDWKATHWRPQDMSLPPVDIDTAATISENKT